MAAALRFLGLLALWVVVGVGTAPGDLAMGVVAAALAAWASMRLAPPRDGPWPRPLALAAFVLRLPWQALVAGIDVARRALHPRLPVAPGTIAFAPALPPGPARDGFLAIASLLPGTLPAGPHPGGGVAIHALDAGQPHAQVLSAEAARFARAIGRRDG